VFCWYFIAALTLDPLRLCWLLNAFPSKRLVFSRTRNTSAEGLKVKRRRRRRRRRRWHYPTALQRITSLIEIERRERGGMGTS